MTMPPGKYYIGDLCYVMHPLWDEVCKITISGQDCLDGQFVLANGVRFATYGTRWGDGTYKDQFGNEYGVDAGLIGCIRIEDIDPSELPNVEDGGHVFEFDRPFHTGSDGSVIHFGHVRIDTDPEEEDDDDDYEEDYEDDEV